MDMQYGGEYGMENGYYNGEEYNELDPRMWDSESEPEYA